MIPPWPFLLVLSTWEHNSNRRQHSATGDQEPLELDEDDGLKPKSAAHYVLSQRIVQIDICVVRSSCQAGQGYLEMRFFCILACHRSASSFPSNGVKAASCTGLASPRMHRVACRRCEVSDLLSIIAVQSRLERTRYWPLELYKMFAERTTMDRIINEYEKGAVLNQKSANKNPKPRREVSIYLPREKKYLPTCIYSHT